MHLKSSIVVNRTNDQVWRFFSQPSSLAKWDRSVDRVIVTSSNPLGVGSTFDTIAPVRKGRAAQEGLRMSYRVAEYVPNHQYKALLIHSPIFRYAEWTMTTDDVPDGVQITCQVDLAVRPQYGFLLPVLLLSHKGAFRRDLISLKQAIEREDETGRGSGGISDKP